MALIEIEKIGLAIAGKRILGDISFSVEKGEVLGLIGPTGAGKTTLLRLIDLVEKATSGRISIDGLDVTSSANARLAMRQRMAFVQQKPVAFNMSVFDNVACGLRWRGVRGHELRSKVGEALEMVDMGDYVRQNAKTLSGGEMQRVAIARSLVTQPEILCLDEPGANLDPVTGVHVESLLARVIQSGKMTVVMSTHDMAQGRRLAQRIALIMNGSLIQIGSPEELFSSPNSREAADFVGIDNIWQGTVKNSSEGMVMVDVAGYEVQAVADYAAGENVELMISAEDVTLSLTRDLTSARNIFKGKIVRIVETGPLARVQLDVGFNIMSLVTRKSAQEMKLGLGQEVFASFKATSMKIIKRWV